MFYKRAASLILCGASALSVAVFAQSSGQTSSSTSAKDKMFVKTAAEGGLAEVQLGQLAAQKASSPDVKSFGQKMVTDHTALNDSMKPIAERMGVTVPTTLSAKDQALYDRLNGMSGAAFDRAYVRAMVADHHKDLKEFTEEMNTTKDPDLKAAVTHGHDVIKEHTDMADQLSKSNGGMAGMNHGGSQSPSQ